VWQLRVGRFGVGARTKHLRGTVVQQSGVLLLRVQHRAREVARDESRDSLGCRHPGHVCFRYEPLPEDLSAWGCRDKRQ
jgi:hypothetical protein